MPARHLESYLISLWFDVGGGGLFRLSGLTVLLLVLRDA